MISSTACSHPLRSSLRPRRRRPSTVHAAAAARADPLPDRALALGYGLKDYIRRESKLDRLRDVFLAPGRGHSMAAPEPRRSSLSLDERKALVDQLWQCRRRSDYVLLVSAVLAQPTLDSRMKQDAVHLVCAALYRQLLDGRHGQPSQKMLSLAHEIRFKLEDAKIPLPAGLLDLGLLCAAHCYSFASLKLYLREYRARNYAIPPDLFNTVVELMARKATPSWLRPWSDEHALAVMLGFTDTQPYAAYDLSVFVPQSDWYCKRCWLRALAALNAHHQLRAEWALWLQAERRQKPKWLNPPKIVTHGSVTTLNRDHERARRLMEAGKWNTAVRGDIDFIEAFRTSGCIEEAWSVVAASDVPFDLLKWDTRRALLARPEFIPPALWTDDMRAELLEKFAADLAVIEAAFEVEWVWDEQAGMGFHRLAPGSWLAELDEFMEDLLPALSQDAQLVADLLASEEEGSSFPDDV
ncbi:hypothetical protein SLS58_011064 [Diplodia intermedia]|uniref:Uncharacterized protein n=1 Tax=Diplodia intermedia TaxID=856260 RepID=A0ABR3T1X8_9PEZI